MPPCFVIIGWVPRSILKEYMVAAMVLADAVWIIQPTGWWSYMIVASSFIMICHSTYLFSHFLIMIVLSISQNGIAGCDFAGMKQGDGFVVIAVCDDDRCGYIIALFLDRRPIKGN